MIYHEPWAIAECASGHQEMCVYVEPGRGVTNTCSRCGLRLEYVRTSVAVIDRQRRGSQVVETLVGRAAPEYQDV